MASPVPGCRLDRSPQLLTGSGVGAGVGTGAAAGAGVGVGVGAGVCVGESTLCRALADWSAGLGPAVGPSEEAGILIPPAFRPVAEEFTGGSSGVRPETLVESTRVPAAESLAAGRGCLVTDTLPPFVPSLVAAGHDESTLVQVMEDLTRAVAPAEVVVVHVHDDPAAALRRAVPLEGTAWEE